jgi:hypothetical protein
MLHPTRRSIGAQSRWVSSCAPPKSDRNCGSSTAIGEALDIAMEPVATYAGEPTILALVNFGTGLALIGADGRLDSTVPLARRFVFALPPRKRLEAGPSVIGIVPN